MTGTGLAVSTRGLVHLYHVEGHDVAALSGVDLHVAAGELLGVLGPSGSGKSTLLALFGGLQRASAGKIFLGDQELSALSDLQLDRLRCGSVGIVLQGAARNLVPYLTPAQNLAFAQRAARRADRTAIPGPEQVLRLVGLTDHASAPLRTLTPGQLQLLALGVAVATYPGLLLTDEPTSALDHAARSLVLDALARINREVGTTVLVVTHDPDVAAAMRRTVTIRDGRLGAQGRDGEQYAVVTADGSLPLPPHALEHFPPGSRVQVHQVGSGYELRAHGRELGEEQTP